MRTPPPFPTYTTDPADLRAGDRVLFGLGLLELVEQSDRGTWRARAVDGFEVAAVAFGRPVLVVSRQA